MMIPALSGKGLRLDAFSELMSKTVRVKMIAVKLQCSLT